MAGAERYFRLLDAEPEWTDCSVSASLASHQGDGSSSKRLISNTNPAGRSSTRSHSRLNRVRPLHSWDTPVAAKPRW
jgi:hypothetical protein